MIARFPKGVSALLDAKIVVPGLILVLLGSMDCLTTLLGTLYFGARELNPFIAALLSTSISAFVFVKLGVTICVAIVFVLAERALARIANRTERSFRVASSMLRMAYVGVIVFLIFVVINNVAVLVGAAQGQVHSACLIAAFH